jgi:hypothetical protein
MTERDRAVALAFRDVLLNLSAFVLLFLVTLWFIHHFGSGIRYQSLTDGGCP